MSQIETEKQQEIEVTNASREKSIETKTNDQISENFYMDKEKIKEQLKSAATVEERIKQFARRSDSYGIEAIVSMIPVIGDLTPSIISTCYLLGEGKQIGLSTKDCLKILGYQLADFLIGAIPIIGDIADFFFKGNKYSSKIFSNHLEKLKKAALEKGMTQAEIDKIGKRGGDFIKTMNRYVNLKSKKNK